MRYPLITAFLLAIIAFTLNDSRADDRAAQLLSKMTDSIRAAQSAEAEIYTEGTLRHYRWSPTEADDAQRPADLAPHKVNSFRYIHRDFGTWKRQEIDSVADGTTRTGVMVDRQVVTPNYRLYLFDAEDDGSIRAGFIDSHVQSQLFCDYLLHFWKDGQDPGSWVPATDAVANLWQVTTESDDGYELESVSVATTVQFHLEKWGDSLLPVRHATLADGLLYSESIWEWEQTDWGTVYPRKTINRSRITDRTGRVMIHEDSYLVDTISKPESVSDDEFTFAALRLEPGSVVTDFRDASEQRFEFHPDANAFLGLVEPAARTPAATQARPLSLLRLAIAATLVTIAAVAAGYFARPLWARS